MKENDEDWINHLNTMIEEISGLVRIYKDKVEGLNSQANNLYELMVVSSRAGTHGAPRKVKHVVSRRIGS